MTDTSVVQTLKPVPFIAEAYRVHRDRGRNRSERLNSTPTQLAQDWMDSIMFGMVSATRMLNRWLTACAIGACSPWVLGGALAHNAHAIPDGAVVACWGANEHGQSGHPPGSESCLDLAMGDRHTVALRSTGAVLCWGDESFGQTVVPSDLGPCIGVGAGWEHSLAITLTGFVRAWGQNAHGECEVPTSVTGAIDAAGGARHSLAVLSDGQVVCWGSNNFGQSTTPPTLPPCVGIAAGRDHSVALTADGRVFCWGGNRTAVAGATRAREFLESVLSGSDSVDILWCGDSNTGFAVAIDDAVSGWCDGIAAALTERGFRQYATPLLPIMPVGTSFGRWTSSVPMPEGLGWTAAGPSEAFNTSGLANAPAELAALMTPGAATGTPAIHPTGVPFDFAWVPPQTNPFYNGGSGILVNANSPMDVRGELHYRVLRSQLASGAHGSYYQGWQYESGIAASPPAQRLTGGAPTEWVADEFTLGADPTRPLAALRATCAGGLFGQSFGVRGPVGFALHSIRRDGRGWASQPLNYHGGATMTAVAQDVANVPIESRQTWLRELVDRQVASGGSGRLIVWIQGGVNADVGTPASWGAAVVTIKSAVEAAWSAIGGSPDNLTFVAMVSHPVTDGDEGLSSLRQHARMLATSVSNLTVVDLADLAISNEMRSHSWYSKQNPIHLTASGYSGLGGRVVDALLERISPCATPSELARPKSCASVSATALGTLARRRDGTVQYWGSPKGDLAVVPATSGDCVQICGGLWHALARTAAGEIVAWGSNGDYQASSPPNIGAASHLAAGGAHSGAIVDGVFECVGDFNRDGHRNGTDLTFILSGWNRPDADCNGDGVTDGFDLTFLIAGWGPCPGP